MATQCPNYPSIFSFVYSSESEVEVGLLEIDYMHVTLDTISLSACHTESAYASILMVNLPTSFHGVGPVSCSTLLPVRLLHVSSGTYV